MDCLRKLDSFPFDEILVMVPTKASCPGQTGKVMWKTVLVCFPGADIQSLQGLEKANILDDPCNMVSETGQTLSDFGKDLAWQGARRFISIK